MKIAVISDIHANLPALDAVLRDIVRQKPDDVWHLGDFTGYGPFPDQTVRRIKAAGIKSIIGNYDLKVLDFSKRKSLWKKIKDPSKFFSFQWTASRLSPDSKAFLRGLRVTRPLTAGGKTFLLTHGSPAGIDDPLTAETPRARFRELALQTGADVVLCGHTHRFFRVKSEDVLFINPGSVGRPFDGDPRASYAIVEVRGQRLTVVHRRVRYPVRETLKAMKKAGFPEDVIRSIASGKSLDQVHAEDAARQERAVVSHALAFARRCRYDKDHSHQVTRLALRLFDELKELHGFGNQEKKLLHAAGLLHDIGWAQGRAGHHKAAMEMIIRSSRLPLPKNELLITALTARYHRRSLPEKNHPYFSSLSPEDQNTVRKLAALLRVADGLDRQHVNSVKDLSCSFLPGRIVIRVASKTFSPFEEEAALKKGDLFRQVFRKDLVIAA
ncbi:MAG: YfcE family phosphodiesterase [Candidatus Omnitrophota bacterium]|nr:YfcE family phosphodiesterase [Candidatus Omnitrophota bacterium]MDZ4243233.1 YfcE family phosphodiesterase [Candidatus Omnitrophota bacterium]